MMSTADVVVVGGGIAGLTAAWELARAGRRVEVLEAGDRTGGLLRAAEVAGATLDVGAESFAIRTSGVADLIADAALPLDVVAPAPEGAHLVWRGRFGRTRRAPLPRRALLGLPAEPGAADVARIIGRRGVRRALAEASLPRDAAAAAEPTLADLAAERFGPRVADLLVEPLCRSVYSQPAASVRLSTLHPALWRAFTDHGSLTAAVAGLAPASRAGSAVRGIAGGMWRLAAELRRAAEAAGAVVRTGAPVRAIRPGTAATEVVLDGTVLTADHVLLATGATAAAALLGVDAAAPAAVRLTTVALSTPALASRPVGTGVIVAPGVPVAAKALTHVDAKWGWAAAALPAGTHVVRLSARDAAVPVPGEPAALARELRRLTGAPVRPAEIDDVIRTDWTDAVVPPSLRATLSDAARSRGVVLLGAVAAGTGLASVIPHARAAARDLLSTTPSEGAPHVR